MKEDKDNSSSYSKLSAEEYRDISAAAARREKSWGLVWVVLAIAATVIALSA